MSENNTLKAKASKCQTKSKKTKKAKQRFRFDLEEIQQNPNSRSCEKLNIKNREFNNLKITNNIFVIKNIDDLQVLPLKDIHYIFSAWKSSNLMFDNFEKKILNKNDFEIMYETFEIKTKNEKAENELKNEEFWILYHEYLFKNNKIKNGDDFLKSINNAFSYLEFGCRLLLVYYLDKIKKIKPILKNGKIEDKDEPYIDLLCTSVKDRIKKEKENLTSDIKIKKNNNQNCANQYASFYEYTPFRKKNRKK
jgi:hypothetical protein